MEEVRQRLGGEVERTQLQLLVSDSGSADQFFHQDNARRGMTVLVPLVDVPLARGPTQLIPGTHGLTLGEGGAAAPVAEAVAAASAVAVLPAVAPELAVGDVLLCDARTLHRGLANRDDTARPVLVFRYDDPKHRPPGHTLVSTLAFRVLGRALLWLGDSR